MREVNGMNDYVLKTTNLTKKYKSQLALNKVDLSIRKGSIYGFIGQNGAGKSTLKIGRAHV